MGTTLGVSYRKLKLGYKSNNKTVSCGWIIAILSVKVAVFVRRSDLMCVRHIASDSKVWGLSN